MNNLFQLLVVFARNAWDRIVEFFETVIVPMLISWCNEVVNYFKQMLLQQNIHVPFIMSTDDKVDNPFSSLISDELKGEGIIEGVYNKDTDKLESLRYVGGNGLDEKTAEVVSKNPLTVLS